IAAGDERDQRACALIAEVVRTVDRQHEQRIRGRVGEVQRAHVGREANAWVEAPLDATAPVEELCCRSDQQDADDGNDFHYLSCRTKKAPASAKRWFQRALAARDFEQRRIELHESTLDGGVLRVTLDARAYRITRQRCGSGAERRRTAEIKKRPAVGK